jgi:TolB-like protein
MIFNFGGFELDTDKFELKQAAKPVNVEPQSILVIRYLVENRDRMVTREDLIDAIWDSRAVSDWAITAAIKSARQALNDDSNPRKFIATVHGKGFRFIADVSVGGKTEEASESPHGDEQTDGLHLVVIPFDDLSEGDDLQYFADGISEDLITDLSQVTGLSIASRNASFSFKNQRLDAQSISRSIEATHILEGSVRHQGDKLRINVQLLETNTADQLWAERFEGSADDIFALQDEINGHIVRTLKVHLAIDTNHRGTRNPKVYDYCLRGRSEYYLYTPEHLARAQIYFEKATELDQKYAEAYAYQAYCRTSAYVFTWPGSDPNLDPAIALAQKAIDLNRNSATSHTRLGWSLGFINRPDEAIASFERAIELDPQNAESWYAYGETLNRLCMPQKALPFLEKAFSLDSFVPPAWDFARGHSRALLGQYESSLNHLLPVLERVPGFIPARVQLTRVYAQMGNIDDAKIAVDAIRKFAPRYKLINAKRMFPYPEIKMRDQFVDALKKAGFPE